MPLLRLQCTHFRNLDGLDLSLSDGVNLITGPNGHGKSNLLEALHFLCLAHSHRTRKEKELCAFGQPRFVLRAEGRDTPGRSSPAQRWDPRGMEGDNPEGGGPGNDNHAAGEPEYRNPEGSDGEDRPPDGANGCDGAPDAGHAHVLAVEAGDGSKRVRVDGVESKRLSDLIGPFPLVAFTPEDLEWLRGGPGERRRFLDVLLCQRDPSALSVLRRYGQALKQRNAALRLAGGGRRAEPLDAALFDAYENTLAESGAEIFLRRRALLEALGPLAAENYARVGEEGEALELRLGRDGEPQDAEGWREWLRRRLAESRAQDRETAVTSAGPHREDLHLSLRGKAVREYGSQGQKRSVALALKLAAADMLEAALGRPPLLLLDDVFAELDTRRRALFGERVRRRGQVFVASPERSEIPFACDAVIELRQGKLRL